MIKEGIFFDRRTLELRYQMPVKNIEPFFKGLEEGKIRATKCKTCGSIYFPPQIHCPRCNPGIMEWIDLDGDGKLETFSSIEIAPTSFQNEGKYIVAIGLLKEGVRALAWIDAKESDLRIGKRIRLVARKKDDAFTYVFNLVE